MLKFCAYKPCSKEFETNNSKKRFHSPKCKKNYENSLRGAPKKTSKSGNSKNYQLPSKDINCPQHLNDVAKTYWNKMAPVLIERGHLNILSEDGFAELCDLYSRLQDINMMINSGSTYICEGCGEKMHIHGNRSLLQIDDKWDNRDAVETKSFKESALSDLKRKYSKLFLDYQRQFYLTPMASKGDFGEIGAKDEKIKQTDGKDKNRFF